MIAIDDSTNLSSLKSRDGAGYVRRPANDSFSGFMAPFDEPLIPESQWPDLISDMNRTKSSLLDMCEDAGVPADHQGTTNFCAPYSAVDTIRVYRVVMNQSPVKLSAASVAAPLNRYRNTGNWCSASIAFIANHGIDVLSHWPQSYWRDKSYYSQDRIQIRMKHAVKDWVDGSRDRNLAFRQLMTCLLRRRPCSSAHMWMSHAVTPCKPVFENGQFGFICRNSGLYRDARGYTKIMGQRAIPDEFVAPRVIVASMVS